MKLDYQFVDVVVVAVVNAVDVPAPTSPLTISCTTVSEPCNTSRQVSCIETVAEVMILDLDHVPTSLDAGRQVIVFAYEGKGGTVLDPAQHV